MAQDLDVIAARIARTQFGLITLAQALYRAGLTERQIQWRMATKRWRRVQRGVFALNGTAATWEQTLLAAQLVARTERAVTSRGRTRLEVEDDAVVAGRSALWLRGCRRLGRPDAHELLVNRQRLPAVKGATLRRTTVLPPEDIEYFTGVATLAVPRLLAELAGQVTRHELAAVLDDLLCTAGAPTGEEIHARAKHLLCGRTGIHHLIALTGPDAPGEFRSWLERHTAGVFIAAQLSGAQWNIEIRDGKGAVIGIGDAVWPEHRVVVELDGLRWHRTPDQQRRDRRKDRRLATAGWLVLRYPWLDVVERPDEVVAEIRAALVSRRPTLG